MTKSDHLPALDGLRGFAALLVVLAHLPKTGVTASVPSLSGSLGVMLFFILSGFLMGHLYLGKPFDRAAAFRYLAARMARVLPLYYLVVIGSFALSLAFGQAFAFHMSTRQFVRLLLLVGHDYVFWSIPPEVQFYFIFLLIWGVAQTRIMVTWLPAVTLLTAILLLLRPEFPGISVLGQLQIFLTGVAIAVVRRRLAARIAPAAALTVQIAGLLACLVALAGLMPVQTIIQGEAASRWKDDIAYANLPFALVVGSVLFAYTIDTRFARMLFANGVAERLGAFSFGIYLLHWPIMQAVHAALAPFPLFPAEIGVIALAATISAAAAAHYIYEMPMQALLRPRIARLLNRVVFARRVRHAADAPEES